MTAHPRQHLRCSSAQTPARALDRLYQSSRNGTVAMSTHPTPPPLGWTRTSNDMCTRQALYCWQVCVPGQCEILGLRTRHANNRTLPVRNTGNEGSVIDAPFHAQRGRRLTVPSSPRPSSHKARPLVHDAQQCANPRRARGSCVPL